MDACGGDEAEPVLVVGRVGALVLPAVEVQAADPAGGLRVGDGLGEVVGLALLADLGGAGGRADLGDPDLLDGVTVADHDAADGRVGLAHLGPARPGLVAVGEGRVAVGMVGDGVEAVFGAVGVHALEEGDGVDVGAVVYFGGEAGREDQRGGVGVLDRGVGGLQVGGVGGGAGLGRPEARVVRLVPDLEHADTLRCVPGGHRGGKGGELGGGGRRR